jgi:Zn-dependent M28 family amino/carboxypeptidase
MRRRPTLIFVLVLLLLAAIAVWVLARQYRPLFSTDRSFDGQRAYQDVLQQVSFGPRVIGSDAHALAAAYIQDELRQAGWKIELQKTTWQGSPVENILATRGGQTPQIILGSHYDSRSQADQDPGPGPHPPVPGANDGASSVAVLLELARTLPRNTIPLTLVFFDTEDDGGLNGMDWLLGSRAYVHALTFQPKAVVILDMIGDKDLNINMERNSSGSLVSQIWKQAADLGHQDKFIPTPKWSMEDDHTPFLEAGLPAVDVIDFDYPYWHTTQDTADKVSPDSLQIVGEVIRAWIIAQK